MAQITNLKCSAECYVTCDIDTIDGGLGDDEHSESDYGEIHKELQAKIKEHIEPEWAVALNEEKGDGIQEKKVQKKEEY